MPSMAPVTLPMAVVAKIPALVISQQCSFEGAVLTNTYFVDQNLAQVESDTQGKNEITIHPIGKKIKIVFNEKLTLNFNMPKNVLYNVTDQDVDEDKGDTEVPPEVTPEVVPPNDHRKRPATKQRVSGRTRKARKVSFEDFDKVRRLASFEGKRVPLDKGCYKTRYRTRKLQPTEEDKDCAERLK